MTVAAGSVQSLVVCVESLGATAVQREICPQINGQIFAPRVSAGYVIDPSQQTNLEASVGPFDFAQAAIVWSAAFTMVVGLYFVSAAIGAVLGMVRRG